MADAPPTSPGPLGRPHRRLNLTLLGMAIHAACVLMTCFIEPVVMQSNLWGLVIVMWSVFFVPPALATGALTGWALRKERPTGAIPLLVFTGIVVAIVVLAIMQTVEARAVAVR